jgi:hypothetical protein
MPIQTIPAAATTKAAPQQLTINFPVLLMSMALSSLPALHSETDARRARPTRRS